MKLNEPVEVLSFTAVFNSDVLIDFQESNKLKKTVCFQIVFSNHLSFYLKLTSKLSKFCFCIFV